jgi:hypothetical protein
MDASLRSFADDGFSGGTRSMYCSPTAETLFTVAVTLSGTGVPLLSLMCATTPSSNSSRFRRGPWAVDLSPLRRIQFLVSRIILTRTSSQCQRTPIETQTQLMSRSGLL